MEIIFVFTENQGVFICGIFLLLSGKGQGPVYHSVTIRG